MRRRFWYALSAFAHYMDMLRGDEADARGLHHTDAPCANCAIREPWSTRQRTWWRRGKGLPT